jgi:tRNA-dihydrouridine synthase B
MRGGSRNPALQIGRYDLGSGLVLAPMAGITDLSFRRVAKSLGAELVFSEMVSAEGLVRNNPGTRFLLQSHPEERPLAVQLFGADPRIMAEAARMVADQGADLVDLNMGCSVPKVVRQGAGAALLLDMKRVEQLVAAVRRAVDIPVTAKIRSGWDQDRINAVEVARRVEDRGANGITVHPRTAKQGFSGAADWEIIARVRQAVSIPVIGNGDVTNPEKVEEIRSQTGCDGVMIGRAAVGYPWIFLQVKQLLAGDPLHYPSAGERLEVMVRHLLLYGESRRDRPPTFGLRRRIMWYSRGLPGSTRLRAALNRCRELEGMLRVCEDYFAGLEKDLPRMARRIATGRGIQ